MKLKGMDKLREKLPDYPGRRLALIPLRGFFAALLCYLSLISLIILPRLFSDNTFLFAFEPYLPLIGSVLIAALGLWLVGGMWNKREQMKTKYGDLAYQRMFPSGLTGVALVLLAAFLGFTSIRSLPPVPPVNAITIQWSTSLLQLIGITTGIDILLRLVSSGILFLLGILTFRSAVFTFGLDYMAVVYLYFPEESEMQHHEIYSVVRHPAYFGGILVGAAGLMFRLSVYSILIFFVILAVFKLQARREERELVERFGESYQDYMRKVPGLYIRPKNLSAFLRFLKQ
ncbi:MAG: methyltransferase family protein [Candidatus Thorarchaeota archaeon]